MMQIPSAELFLGMFDPSVHAAIESRLARPGVIGVACFENQDFSSSRFGDRTALIYGPGCTIKTRDEIAKQRLGDVPSRFQYPVAYYEKAFHEKEPQP